MHGSTDTVSIVAQPYASVLQYLGRMEPTSWYPVVLSLHLIFMVTFFSGTFYLMRLFIFHRDALALWEPDRTILITQYKTMERPLLYVVAWPSILMMVGTGALMLWWEPGLLMQPWMQAKLGLVALLIAYHLTNQRLYSRLGRNEGSWPSYGLRLWVQGSVILLFALVFLSTMKNVQWYVGLLGLAVLVVLLLSAVKFFGGKKPISHTDAEAGGPRT